MSDDIEVKITKYADRRHWVMYYVDPVTEKKVPKSTKQTTEAAALKAAGQWQEQLRAGTYSRKSNTTWEEARRRYEDEKLDAGRDSSAETAASALNHIERIVSPKKLAALNSGVLSRFQASLRTEGLATASIHTHLAHIHAMLSWAVSVGLLREVPRINRPKLPKGKRMKGRPITLEEFERMLDAVPKVRKRDAPVFERYLQGLWLSGLRLEESLELSWDLDEAFVVDLEGRRPKFRIDAEAEKGNTHRVSPMVPEFAEFLAQTPPEDRHGPVFPIISPHTKERLSKKRVSLAVTAIGQAAKVVVDRGERRLKEKGEDGTIRWAKKPFTKYASAHDLRRAFGTRWAKLVMPPVLQQLMRHANIETTLRYYVDLDADSVADELWAIHESRQHSVNSSTPKGGMAKPKTV